VRRAQPITAGAPVEVLSETEFGPGTHLAGNRTTRANNVVEQLSFVNRCCNHFGLPLREAASECQPYWIPGIGSPPIARLSASNRKSSSAVFSSALRRHEKRRGKRPQSIHRPRPLGLRMNIRLFRLMVLGRGVKKQIAIQQDVVRSQCPFLD